MEADVRNDGLGSEQWRYSGISVDVLQKYIKIQNLDEKEEVMQCHNTTALRLG